MGSPGADTPPPEPRRRSASEDQLSPAAAAAAADARSPYENVSFVGYPQSPRTRIRTTVQRERLDGREASPPVSAGGGSVYMVPPPPVPLPTPPPRTPLGPAALVNGSSPAAAADRHSFQFVNEEYMRGLPLDPSFQNDDLVFLPVSRAGGSGMADRER